MTPQSLLLKVLVASNAAITECRVTAIEGSRLDTLICLNYQEQDLLW